MIAPERIYLQDAGDYECAAEFEVTWCSEPQDDCDTEYIRADLVKSLIQAAHDLDRKYCDDDLGPSALAMGKLREAYMRIK